MDRRCFIGTAFAAFGGLVFPADAFGADVPKMKLGVLSDIHIGAKESENPVDTEGRLERALRWLDANGVDAVMVPGDIAHSGKISELERFAAIWDRVFPDGRGADGRPVERLFVTGNHDLEAWWVKGTPEWRAANVFSEGDNPRKVWRRLFHEDWQLIWRKVVKGYTFVGAQWPTAGVKPPIERWFRDHAAELSGSKPFFYVQHAHPRGTCGDGKISYDHGEATSALMPFANAVAISGHSHQTIVDESSVWQGAFTSINAGCLRAGGNDRHGVGAARMYDSTYPSYSAMRNQNRMIPLDGSEGGCGMLIDVFDDHLVVHRRSLVYDRPLGDDWCIALPATAGGPFDPVRQRATDVGPEFGTEAKVEAKRCPVAPEAIAGPALRGRPCVWLKIPHPNAKRAGSRVYDFKVEMLVGGQLRLERLVLANGFNVPVEMSGRDSNCLFDEDEVPRSGNVCFRVTPRTSFGVSGKAVLAFLP